MTTTWNNLNLNVQNIIAQTDRATLIQLPHKVAEKLGISEGYQFWYPSKLIRQQRTGKGWLYTFGITEDFSIRLIKKGQGKYNKATIIKEKEISGKELIKNWSK
jgi:hypothetical protein